MFLPRISTPFEWYWAQQDDQKPKRTPMNPVNRIVYLLWTILIVATPKVKNETPKASHPWSIIIPKGDDDPVFLACFPSTLSIVWYTKIQDPKTSKVHGTTYEPIPWKAKRQHPKTLINNPATVIALGAQF